ncbi:Vps54-domain-containing protein [Thelephora ganbajun]|uniref:Vps54-domain-containing protein n=1 Tax=Thelephora ganbajun TaxID=370292 RepID=A0ACB6ZP77_THEGA|nr:Vps54-domain-containing protein [Thelephora ganbajun]
MSDNDSVSSLPTSPVTAVPDSPTKPIRKLTRDNLQRRGAASVVSETTEGNGDYFGSANLPFSFSSASLALSAVPQEWSSSKHGFHAISTVVNNPHKRSAPPKAHAPVPPVTPVVLPRPNRKILDQYAQNVASDWNHLLQSRLNVNEQLEGSLSDPLGTLQHVGKEFPPLDSVPSVFFDPQFSLGNPRMFREVTGQEEDQHALDPATLAYSLPLIEKLSHHADTVEQHLILEVSLRSSSFFAALSNLQDLQTESEQCTQRIAQLKSMLKEVDDRHAKRGLEIVHVEHKLRNLETIKSGVRMIAGVVEMTGVVKGLVNAGQWGDALTVLEEIHGLWDEDPAPHPPISSQVKPTTPRQTNPERVLSPVQESPCAEDDIPLPLISSSKTARPSDAGIPLSSLRAFSSLPEHLQTLTLEIASSLTTELVEVLRLDLTERIPGLPSREALDQSLGDRLRPLLQGLLRTKSLREATISWRDVALAEVRNCAKLFVGSQEPVEETPDVVPVPDNEEIQTIRSKPHEEFMRLVSSMFAALLNCVEGSQRQNAIFMEVLEAVQSPRYPVDVEPIREELADVLSSMTELANVQASTAINARSEQHTSLPLPEFLDLFNQSWNFVLKCEVICRRMIVGLRGVIVSQAKSFLQAFHQDRISRSARLVEGEQWNPAEVPQTIQHLVKTIVEAAVRDPPELVVGADPPPLSVPNSPTVVTSPSSPNPARVSKHLRVEGVSYFAVSATLETLVLLLDYFKIIVNLSMLTTDTMSRIIEFLKAFNSRTCQVVLGAGAMRSAGLKVITAKHLALASQSLSIVIALVPYVRETLRRHLSLQQAVMLTDFDRLKRDYQEHQNEIHAKLIAIMGDRLAIHINSLQSIDWDTLPTNPGINNYMEVLVKETVTLYKLLSRYLSVSVVEYVMSQVLAAINHNLQEEYTAIRLPNQGAKDRLLADAKFLHEKLSALKNIQGASTAMLVTVVSEKVPANAPGRLPANQRIKGMLSRSNSGTQEDTVPPPQPPVGSISPLPAPTSRPDSPVPPRPASPQLSPQPVGSPANGTSANSRPVTPVLSPPLPPLPSQSPESASNTQPNGANGH